jgi:recombinational DNA repair protein RecR
MNDLAPQLALPAALTIGVGAVMIRLALDRRLLQSGKVERRCQSCGRLIRTPVCPLCSEPTRWQPRSAPSRMDDR